MGRVEACDQPSLFPVDQDITGAIDPYDIAGRQVAVQHGCLQGGMLPMLIHFRLRLQIRFQLTRISQVLEGHL